jgi:hypothetical protein
MRHIWLIKFALVCIFLLALVKMPCLAASASGAVPASQAQLTEITNRGRLLAEYEKAGTRAIKALGKAFPKALKDGSFTHVLPNKSDSGWTVSFGTLIDRGDTFNVAYEAIEEKGSKKYKVRKCKPGTGDKGVLLGEARATIAAFAAFPRKARKNNYAILPTDNHNFYVYIYPAQAVADLFPFGDDIRFKISADGFKILEARRMHRSLIQNKKPSLKNPPAMGVHIAVMADEPEDTDVMHVLVRKPSMGEMIATPHFVYKIETDGSIKYLGTIEKVLKKKKSKMS